MDFEHNRMLLECHYCAAAVGRYNSVNLLPLDLDVAVASPPEDRSFYTSMPISIRSVLNGAPEEPGFYYYFRFTAPCSMPR